MHGYTSPLDSLSREDRDLFIRALQQRMNGQDQNQPTSDKDFWSFFDSSKPRVPGIDELMKNYLNGGQSNMPSYMIQGDDTHSNMPEIPGMMDPSLMKLLGL